MLKLRFCFKNSRNRQLASTSWINLCIDQDNVLLRVRHRNKLQKGLRNFQAELNEDMLPKQVQTDYNRVNYAQNGWVITCETYLKLDLEVAINRSNGSRSADHRNIHWAYNWLQNTQNVQRSRNNWMLQETFGSSFPETDLQC